MMGGGQGDEGDDVRVKEKSSREGVPVPREKRHARAETETRTLGCPVMSLRTFIKHNDRKLLQIALQSAIPQASISTLARETGPPFPKCSPSTNVQNFEYLYL